MLTKCLQSRLLRTAIFKIGRRVQPVVSFRRAGRRPVIFLFRKFSQRYHSICRFVMLFKWSLIILSQMPDLGKRVCGLLVLPPVWLSFSFSFRFNCYFRRFQRAAFGWCFDFYPLRGPSWVPNLTQWFFVPRPRGHSGQEHIERCLQLLYLLKSFGPQPGGKMQILPLDRHGQRRWVCESVRVGQVQYLLGHLWGRFLRIHLSEGTAFNSIFTNLP